MLFAIIMILAYDWSKQWVLADTSVIMTAAHYDKVYNLSGPEPGPSRSLETTLVRVLIRMLRHCKASRILNILVFTINLCCVKNKSVSKQKNENFTMLKLPLVSSSKMIFGLFVVEFLPTILLGFG